MTGIRQAHLPLPSGCNRPDLVRFHSVIVAMVLIYMVSIFFLVTGRWMDLSYGGPEISVRFALVEASLILAFIMFFVCNQNPALIFVMPLYALLASNALLLIFNISKNYHRDIGSDMMLAVYVICMFIPACYFVTVIK